MPSLTIRKVEFLSMDHLFKPDNISVVMRKDKNLISYKSDFIKILFGEEITSRVIYRCVNKISFCLVRICQS